MPVVRQHHPEHRDRQLGHGRLQGHHPPDGPADHELRVDDRHDTRRPVPDGGHPGRGASIGTRRPRGQGLRRRQPRRRHGHPGRVGRVLAVQGGLAGTVHERRHRGRLDQPQRRGIPRRPSLSPTAYVTSAGRYCWRAVFSGDAANGIPGSSDSRATECFTVNPVTPTPVDAPPAPTCSSATPSPTRPPWAGRRPSRPTRSSTPPGTAGAAAGGTITFKLYGPSEHRLRALVVHLDRRSRSAATARTTRPAPQFVPTPPGDYHWVAVYSGNLPNTNGLTHNAACTDTDEDVIVNTVPSSMTTAQTLGAERLGDDQCARGWRPGRHGVLHAVRDRATAPVGPPSTARRGRRGGRRCITADACRREHRRPSADDRVASPGR